MANTDSASFVEHIQRIQITTQLSRDDIIISKNAKEDLSDIKMRKTLEVMKCGIHVSIAQMTS